MLPAAITTTATATASTPVRTRPACGGYAARSIPAPHRNQAHWTTTTTASAIDQVISYAPSRSCYWTTGSSATVSASRFPAVVVSGTTPAIASAAVSVVDPASATVLTARVDAP